MYCSTLAIINPILPLTNDDNDPNRTLWNKQKIYRYTVYIHVSMYVCICMFMCIYLYMFITTFSHK